MKYTLYLFRPPRNLPNLPLEVFAYFLFSYIVRQVSDPKMASLPNHYVANSSSFGNTPQTHRSRTIPPRSNGFREQNTHTRTLTHTHTPRTATKSTPVSNTAAKLKTSILHKHRGQTHNALSNDDTRYHDSNTATATLHEFTRAQQHTYVLYNIIRKTEQNRTKLH